MMKSNLPGEHFYPFFKITLCVLLFSLSLLSQISEIYKNLSFVRLPKECNTLLRHTPEALDWKVLCWTLPSASKELR